MAVTYSQNGVIVNPRNISLVEYSPAQSNSLIVDKNGYIGVKQPAGGNTYFAYVDHRADYSQSGLGQVYIINKLEPIGKLIINGNEYGLIQLDNWLIIDRNLTEPIGVLNRDYILPDASHEDAGYFYYGTSLYNGSTSTPTQLAQDFLSTVGDGWEFFNKEFLDFFKLKYNNIDSTMLRKETWNNGLNILGLNFVGARYGVSPSIINYSASILPARVGNTTYWLQINESGPITYPIEAGVLGYYNPNRIIKKLT